MRVSVRLYAALDRFRPPDAAPGRAFSLDVEQGTTIEALRRQLGLPSAMTRVCAVNGSTADLGTVLNDGDEVALLPQASGGSTDP